MARKSNLQVWAEYIPARLVLGGLGLLPRQAAVKIGMALGRFFFLVTGGRKDVSLKNLEIAFPEKSPAERKALLKGSFENLGRILGDASQFAKYERKDLEEMVEFDFESEEALDRPERKYLDAERKKGRGVIVVGPHLGNWEMGVFAYSAIREPVQFLARPLDNPKIEEMVGRLRARFGNVPVNKNNSVGAALEILGKGGVLGALPDVNVRPTDGVFVPFFGKLACTTRGLAMLAIRTNAFIVPMSCTWNAEKGRYFAAFGKFLEVDRSAGRHDEIYRLTAEMTQEMEKFIRAAPDQWIWTHKRWKSRPPGEDALY